MAIEFYFSCITPSASGGEPMQIYYMAKDGIEPSRGTSAKILITVFYKGVLLLLGLFVMIFAMPEALKTNLLLWGVVAPNIQLEIPLGRQNRWSLELAYFTPWFIWGHNSHASQCQNWGAEVRYWLGNRKQRRWLQGWHVGIAVAGGYYDFEWKKHEGYQGEHLNTYVNIGYQHRWGDHWGLDFGVGAGALFTKYRHYYGGSVYPDNHLEEWDEHLIYHDKGTFTWAGPCHANITLAYFFNAWPLRTKPQKLENR
jgi:hypothetical protein